MTEPGWYPDYEDPMRMRYHDGNEWTEHLHVPSEPVGPARAAADFVPPTLTTAPQQESRASSWSSLAILGLFAGLLVGGFIFNAVGALTPVTESRGVVERLDIEYSTRGSQSAASSNTRTYVLFGRTDSGEQWRISDEDAYNVVQSQGYPQDVTVAMGDWTGTAERVVGQGWQVDHQTTGARIGWFVMLGVFALLSIGGTVLIAKSRSGGLGGAVIFLVALLGPGSWLGYQAFQWFQSG